MAAVAKHCVHCWPSMQPSMQPNGLLGIISCCLASLQLCNVCAECAVLDVLCSAPSFYVELLGVTDSSVCPLRSCLLCIFSWQLYNQISCYLYQLERSVHNK